MEIAIGTIDDPEYIKRHGTNVVYIDPDDESFFGEPLFNKDYSK